MMGDNIKSYDLRLSCEKTNMQAIEQKLNDILHLIRYENLSGEFVKTNEYLKMKNEAERNKQWQVRAKNSERMLKELIEKTNILNDCPDQVSSINGLEDIIKKLEKIKRDKNLKKELRDKI